MCDSTQFILVVTMMMKVHYFPQSQHSPIRRRRKQQLLPAYHYNKFDTRLIWIVDTGSPEQSTGCPEQSTHPYFNQYLLVLIRFYTE